MAETMPHLHMLVQQKLCAAILKTIQLRGIAVVFHKLGASHVRGLNPVEGEVSSAGYDT